MAPLAARLVERGVVYPTIRVASRPGRLLMGVFDAEGRYVDDTVLNRRSGEQGEPVPTDLFPRVQDAEVGEGIYAGPLYFHFGHFLLESLARAWYASRHPAVPLMWAGQHDWQHEELKAWQTEVLDILGLTNPTRIVADPTRFGRLHVPDLGYRYDDTFHPEHAAFLGRYVGPAQQPGRRLWLSRSGIGTDVRDLNAGATERQLVASGWTVVHPESLPVREQLDELSRAEVVAGEEGSAFHSLVLLSDVGSKEFRILRRHGREHRNLRTIGEARGVDQTFHTVKDEVVLRAEGRVVSKVSPGSAEALDLLGVAVRAAPTVPRDADAAALGRVVAHLRPHRLLDVGASTAGLVVGSAAQVRVAVSPRFDFDPRAFAGSGVAFYELDLDRYADLFHTDPHPFDVIALSGADLAEVMTSFRTSARLAGDCTTWVLGTGDLAARAAVTVGLTRPGYTARRLLLPGRVVYIARRRTDALVDDAGVDALSAPELRRWARRLRLGATGHARRRVRTVLGRARRFVARPLPGHARSRS